MLMLIMLTALNLAKQMKQTTTTITTEKPIDTGFDKSVLIYELVPAYEKGKHH